MKNSVRLLAFAAIMFLFISLAGPAAAQTKPVSHTITIGTGGIVGVYYPVGGALCRLVNQGRAQHGIRCAVESTGASVYNINAIRSGDLSLGVVQSDIQYYAVHGLEQFKDSGADTKLRALFSLHPEPFTLVARREAAVNSLQDLPGKRVNIGDTGSGNRATMNLLMAFLGWKPSVFKPASQLAPAEMTNALCGNEVDVYVYVIGHPNPTIKNNLEECNAKLVPINGPQIEQFISQNPFYPATAIPGNTYPSEPEDVVTFGPRATIVASADLPDDVAYQLVKAVFDNLDNFKKQHPSLRDLTAAEMLKANTAPFHPGAVKYYKEIGLM